MAVTIKYVNGTYIGPVNENLKRHGVGIFTFGDGMVFEGSFDNDIITNGKFTYADGYTMSNNFMYNSETHLVYVEGEIEKYDKNKDDKYVGEWHDGKPHGKGKRTLKGQVYEGTWKNGILTDGSINMKNTLGMPTLKHSERSVGGGDGGLKHSSRYVHDVGDD